MTEKHTPGPWRVDKRVPTQTLGPDGFITADCNILSLRKGAPTEERCAANARLVAAAPELLEALIGVVRIADRATTEFDAARAAIAKAGGGHR